MYDVCNTNDRVKRSRFPDPSFRFLSAGPQYSCALHKKGGRMLTTSARMEVSRPILPLLDYRPPSLVRVELDGGVCCGLLVLAGPVPEPHCWYSGLGGGTLEDCWKFDGGLNTRYLPCTSNLM